MAGSGNLKRRREQPASVASSQEADKVEVAEAAEPTPKRARVEASRTLFVRSLPADTTDEGLADWFSQHYPVKHATIVRDRATNTSRCYGFVTFTDADDAKEAKQKLHNQKLNGKPISIDIAEPRQRKGESASATSQKEQRKAALEEARKVPKLIIRNLPWSIKTSDQLAALFRSFGKVKFADLPQNKGKLKGFGFVSIRGFKNSEKALESVNGKTVDGRVLAVDWAVDKDQWEKYQHEEDSKDVVETEAGNADENEDKDNDDEDKDDDDEEEDEDLRNFMKNHIENLEDEDSAAEGAAKDKENEDDDDDEWSSEKEEDEKPAKKLMTTTNTTVFIRNLPFTTTDAELKAHFEQFGLIRYARVVMDRATDRAAGTGFVCFVKEEDCKSCLIGAPRPRQPDTQGKRSILQDEMADEEGRYTMEGRVLQVSQAVSKDEASRLTADGVAARDGKDKDKRRLYLLSEGTISKGSTLYSLLPPSEVKMREDSAAQRKKLIQSNPSLHLSLTRLALRNIPKNMSSKELKALAREAIVGFAKDVKEGLREHLSKEEISRGGTEEKEAEQKRKEKGKGVVKQAKIVYENKQGSKVAEEDGAAKSRGYGFIEYHSHRSALMGLRWLNGHALKNAAGKTQRLIVEFAIDNAHVVSRRKEFQAKTNKGFEQRSEAPEKSKTIKEDGKARKDGELYSKSKFKRFGKKDSAANEDANGNDGKSKKSAKVVLEQKIIGRKRLMKKKKAKARGGN